jgi:hypothetical protein
MDVKEYLDSLSPAELQAMIDKQNLDAVRRHRDELLKETDWWVLPDRTPTEAQLAYRQQLRDITETCNNLIGAVWPTKP